MVNMLTREDLAKYPFVSGVAPFVEKHELALKKLNESEYPKIVRRAIDRVKASIERRTYNPDFGDLDVEILSYPLALAIVYGLKKEWVIVRFATGEQKLIKELLQNEALSLSLHATREKFIEIAKEGFNWNLRTATINLEWQNYDFTLPVWEFLEVASRFNSSNWKLVNRYLENGKVYLSYSQTIRLLSEAVKNKIIKRATETEIKSFELPEIFTPHLDEIRKLAEKKKPIYEEDLSIRMVEDARPPCIIAIINDLKSGKNLSHMARFTITSFMINTGATIDEVISLFNQVADFDGEKTRYQIEHIAGRIGTKTKYNPPKCDVLRSFGLCVGADEMCQKLGMRHPLRYYKVRARELAKLNKPGGISPASAGTK
jgi:DNA primase large subunit